jgi:DNA-binding response OmpR family regulator
MVKEEKIKVLVVDDDPVVVDVTTAGLELDDFEVSTAVDGRSGVTKTDEVHPDVVLLDLRLPDIDGFEVLRQIRSKPANTDIHVIMITGDHTIDIDKAFALGADDCIIKPIDMRFLVSRISKLLKKKYHVLIVEDDRQICEVLKNMLEKHDYDVAIFHDGNTIIEAIKQSKPDIILLDISLPIGPDGFELCKTIKNDPATKTIPVIMLTANEYANAVEKSFSFGAEDYIFKPFNVSELISKIKKYLRISIRNK